MSKYLELARKINELAKRGVGGERDAAEIQLKKLMAKHGITMLEIEGEKEEEYRVKCEKEDYKFFCQVVGSVRGSVCAHHSLGYAYFDCTAAEFAEIEIKFKFYRVRLKDTMQAAYSAFIAVNELYKFETEEEKQERWKREAIEGRKRTDIEKKAEQMARGLRPEEFHKQLK